MTDSILTLTQRPVRLVRTPVQPVITLQAVLPVCPGLLLKLDYVSLAKIISSIVNSLVPVSHVCSTAAHVVIVLLASLDRTTL